MPPARVAAEGRQRWVVLSQRTAPVPAPLAEIARWRMLARCGCRALAPGARRAFSAAALQRPALAGGGVGVRRRPGSAPLFVGGGIFALFLGFLAFGILSDPIQTTSQGAKIF